MEIVQTLVFFHTYVSEISMPLETISSLLYKLILKLGRFVHFSVFFRERYIELFFPGL